MKTLALVPALIAMLIAHSAVAQSTPESLRIQQQTEDANGTGSVNGATGSSSVNGKSVTSGTAITDGVPAREQVKVDGNGNPTSTSVQGTAGTTPQASDARSTVPNGNIAIQPQIPIKPFGSAAPSSSSPGQRASPANSSIGGSTGSGGSSR